MRDEGRHGKHIGTTSSWDSRHWHFLAGLLGRRGLSQSRKVFDVVAGFTELWWICHVIVGFLMLVIAEPCTCAVCHNGASILSSSQCSGGAGRGYAIGGLGGGGGKKQGIMNESHGLRLIL